MCHNSGAAGNSETFATDDNIMNDIFQCINTTSVTYTIQQKTVVERKCHDVPDQECQINTVVKDNPVNSTECKIEKENKCSIVTVPTKEKECRKILEKKCKTVSEVVTNIVQVRFQLS